MGDDRGENGGVPFWRRGGGFAGKLLKGVALVLLGLAIAAGIALRVLLHGAEVLQALNGVEVPVLAVVLVAAAVGLWVDLRRGKKPQRGREETRERP
jgi:hypothetical protein